jgi:hypothetical protein
MAVRFTPKPGSTQKRWSPIVQLERLVEAELAARLRQRVERRLKASAPGPVQADGRFRMGVAHPHSSADRRTRPDPRLRRAARKCDRRRVSRAGQTMIANNLVHQAILAGHSARFLTAADLILDLTKQETARVLQQRLRTYMRPAPLAIDDVGYLSYDAHAADPLPGRESSLRAEVLGDHNEPPLQAMGAPSSECRLRSRAHRPPDASRRDHHD